MNRILQIRIMATFSDQHWTILEGPSRLWFTEMVANTFQHSPSYSEIKSTLLNILHAIASFWSNASTLHVNLSTIRIWAIMVKLTVKNYPLQYSCRNWLNIRWSIRYIRLIPSIRSTRFDFLIIWQIVL